METAAQEAEAEQSEYAAVAEVRPDPEKPREARAVAQRGDEPAQGQEKSFNNVGHSGTRYQPAS